MTSATSTAVPPTDAPPDPALSPPPLAAEGGIDTSASVIYLAQAVVAEWVSTLRGRMELASLELRRAGMALMQVLMLAIVAGLLVWSAWLALMVGVYLAGLAGGLHWSLALLIVIGLNLALAAGLWRWAQKQVVYLTFPATMRALRRPRDAQP